MRKSDPRTCRILHWVAEYAQIRQYNGYCRNHGDGFSMYYGNDPSTVAGEGLFPFSTLEEVLDHFFRLADKAFHLERATLEAFRIAMWDERDGTKYFCHPTWQEVDAAMQI